MLREETIPLHDLIVEIHELDRKLQTLEEKYGLLSADFYQLYEAGQWQGEEMEEIDEFGRWVAWYRLRARRIGQYEAQKNVLITNLSNRHLLRQKTKIGGSQPSSSRQVARRVGNLHPGNFRMSDDFDAPLPDELTVY